MEGRSLQKSIRAQRGSYLTPLIAQCLCLLIALSTLSSAGCMRFLAQTLYVVKGHKTPAKFEGLAGKRVAVICISDSASFGPDSVTHNIAKLISLQLGQNVKDIEIIPQNKIENWRDVDGWDNFNYVEFGRGLKADMVVAIELSSYSIAEGSTMFKGRSRVATNVYDIEQNGKLVFTEGPEDFVFPRDGRPRIQTSERDFETKYLTRLTLHLSQFFYKHDKMDTVDNDSVF
jgi:hypothetical protein